MKEVYRGNEIIKSLHQDHLFQYHDWLIQASKQYNSNLEYEQIHISSLQMIQDDKFDIKKSIHRDIWIKNEFQNLYSNRISNGYLLAYRGAFEINAYDEECIYSDKTGVGYKENFFYEITHIGMYEEDNKFKYLNQTGNLDIKLIVSDSEAKDIAETNLVASYNLSRDFASGSDLTFEEYKIKAAEEHEKEKDEILNSWKGFEHEIS